MNLEMQLSQLSIHLHGLKFIQIGAWDGVTKDPIRPLILKYHWRGILVEPQEKFFELLQKNYENIPHLQFENCAICDKDGITDFYLSKKTDCSSIIPHKKRPTCIQVPCMSLKTLINLQGMDIINFLQIDVEGYDFEIIKQINGIAHPRIIHFEWKNLGKQTLECFCFLQDHGYKLYGGDSWKDALAIKGDFNVR